MNERLGTFGMLIVWTSAGILIVLVLPLASPAFGQANPYELKLTASLTNHPVDPFRKVNKADWDLRPIFEWDKEYTRMELARVRGLPARQAKPRPLPWWKSDYRKIVHVLDDGLLLEDLKDAALEPSRMVFLTNYPNFNILMDGDEITFIAITNGVIKMEYKIGRGHYTIESLDYGIPYNPFELQKDGQRASSRTNSPKMDKTK